MNNILNPTKQENDEAISEIIRTQKEQKPLYERALKFQNRLGIGGLWKGTHTVLVEIINELRENAY